MPDIKNPMPFNPEGLTVRQSKDACDTLRTIFHIVERYEAGEITDVDNIIYNIIGQRDGLARQWRR